MRKKFYRYLSVGVLNTGLHWILFFVFYSFDLTQSASNFLAFLIAVTFSFFVNTKFTFETKADLKKYIMYTLFLGGVAALLGTISDIVQLPPLLTLLLFSGISLFAGFTYSNYIVFKRC